MASAHKRIRNSPRFALIYHLCHILDVITRHTGLPRYRTQFRLPLRQRFEGSVGSFWTVTQSQIYRELHGLERDPSRYWPRRRGPRKPDRRTYALTDAGRDALRAWLNEPLQPMQLRSPAVAEAGIRGVARTAGSTRCRPVPARHGRRAPSTPRAWRQPTFSGSGASPRERDLAVVDRTRRRLVRCRDRVGYAARVN